MMTCYHNNGAVYTKKTTLTDTNRRKWRHLAHKCIFCQLCCGGCGGWLVADEDLRWGKCYNLLTKFKIIQC